MSHVATISLEVKDLDALGEACKQLGLELVHGQQTYRWFGKHVGDYPVPAGFTVEDLGKCEHAVRIPLGQQGADQAYEIGVVRRRDGKPGYTLLWDFWAGGYGLQAKVGDNCKHLVREYGLAVAARKALAKGFQVQRQVNAQGQPRLRLFK
jgi:hypothetical protein